MNKTFVLSVMLVTGVLSGVSAASGRGDSATPYYEGDSATWSVALANAAFDISFNDEKPRPDQSSPSWYRNFNFCENHYRLLIAGEDLGWINSEGWFCVSSDESTVPGKKLMKPSDRTIEVFTDLHIDLYAIPKTLLEYIKARCLAAKYFS